MSVGSGDLNVLFEQLKTGLAKPLQGMGTAFSASMLGLAGALVVGRFEDGTPVALQRGEGMHNPVPNNFNYAIARRSSLSFQAHVRKTNPRGDTVRQFGVPDEDERGHRIARRGIIYGKRLKHPSAEQTPDEMPTGGVGLLFMCFQSDIANQFEFMQSSWANNSSFVKSGTGVDPVIGQTTGGEPPQNWPKEWGNAHSTIPFDFHSFVKMLGGEYFFAPCISFLTAV
jgi:deferrochelatase/peroxidase EfeB